MRELFIYYRVAEADANVAFSTANACQARLRERHPGLVARLLRRPDAQIQEGRSLQTWMEIYSMPQAEGVSPALEAEIAREASAMAAIVVGTRHTEVFVPCAS